ncbi:TetR/AcrR family transcriptional regulator [Paenibacillus sp. UMB7766-LJ446]|jgi:AcrR family transcriptional regulator|uniref:TetR/AcrR family transcriptional regulator n=1 Tax=Paenibacillus TaxID=44249 RepID=UPI000422026A|nr:MULTISPECIES: TetR/AcrR family transcriptional regulator [Paenibacillus]MDK8194841.1 TetR/AcrR family transcriptional regulator [Paenibacillus sp. UMB7766-LJ446]OZQ69187.1 TetR family transcriptional regulator [Paenibacillus taichungensis]HBU85886.1 TetR/AcrR family transcriptional regulator [Paenibacillus sp.]
MTNEKSISGSLKSKSSNPVNRTKAVEVAAQLFLRQGYSYVSMDEVVRASGVSKSNIYYHFKNKEELLQAVVQYWIAQYESELYLLLSQREREVTERIYSFIALLSAGMEGRDYKGSCPFITLYMQTPASAPEVKESIARFFRELQPIMEKLVQQGMDRGEFRKGIEPGPAAALFIAALEGSLVLAETARDIGIIEQSARTFCQMLR